MLVKRCRWCYELFLDAWNRQYYFNKPFYDQGAIIKCLRMRQEGLTLLYSPFHSYLPGSYQGVKFFPHVAVFPHYELNTNFTNDTAIKTLNKKSRKKLNTMCDAFVHELFVNSQREREEASNLIDTPNNPTDVIVPCLNPMSYDKKIAKFIFHAAGNCGKIDTLQAIIKLYQLEVNQTLSSCIN